MLLPAAARPSNQQANAAYLYFGGSRGSVLVARAFELGVISLPRPRHLADVCVDEGRDRLDALVEHADPGHGLAELMGELPDGIQVFPKVVTHAYACATTTASRRMTFSGTPPMCFSFMGKLRFFFFFWKSGPSTGPRSPVAGATQAVPDCQK